MGLLSSLGRTIRPATRAQAAMASIPSGAWLGSIPTDVLEAFGISTSGPVTRKDAIGIPSMRRGRQIIAGTIGTLPLQALRPGSSGLEPVDRGATATLLGQLDPRTTPQWTLTWTVDDLLFGGIAWWRKLQVDADGWPLSVERIAPGRWQLVGSKVYVDGREVPDRQLIRFDGPDAGVLVEGAEALRTCLLLEKAAKRNSTGLPPMDILRPAEGAPDATDEEAAALLDKWRGLRAENGTGWLNRSIEHEVVGFDARAAQLNEARQHQAVEVARLLNLDAQELNAPAATGMTYTNTEAKRRDRIESLSPYITAVVQRLSMPDVTPRGQRVQLDTASYLRGTSADAIKAAVEASGGPVMTPEESREALLDLPGQPELGQLRTPSTPAPAEETA